MSQTKAQLVAPIGVVTASGVVASGVVTAATFDGNVTGTATSIKQGANLNVGIMSASGFSGDFTGSATGITTGSDIKVGAFTASSFTGDFTGTATSMMRGTGFKAGAVNATGFHVSGSSSGNVTGNVTGNIVGDVTGVATGNITGDVTGNITGYAKSVTSGANIHVGVMTAASYYGDGSNLTGIAATNFNTQTVTANSAETIIDLSDGNMITMNQSASTTVGFASTSTAMAITIIRIKDTGGTARTITWPDSVKWNGGSAPTLIQDTISGDSQQFELVTGDSGLTWYGWEPYKVDVKTYELWMMGNNNNGQLGLNDTVNRSSPTQMGTGALWNVSLTGYQSQENFIAVKPDGTLWGAGGSFIGYGPSYSDNAKKSSPTQIGTSSDWTKGGNFSKNWGMLAKTDGTLWIWGNNGYGMLGQNNTTPSVSPIQMMADNSNGWPSDPNKYGTQQYVAFAIDNANQLWHWGFDSYGMGGQNDGPFGGNRYKSSPTRIGTSTDWKYVRPMNSQVLAIKESGQLWGWGANDFGTILSNPTNRKRSSPTNIGQGSTYTKPFCQGNGSLVTKTDGSLWSWGYNNKGQLGDNSTSNNTSPRSIGSENIWDQDQVVQANNCVHALKTNGTAWGWGNNPNGLLGHNDETSYSSPRQIPGAWSGVTRGWGWTGLIKDPTA